MTSWLVQVVTQRHLRCNNNINNISVMWMWCCRTFQKLSGDLLLYLVPLCSMWSVSVCLHVHVCVYFPNASMQVPSWIFLFVVYRHIVALVVFNHKNISPQEMRINLVSFMSMYCIYCGYKCVCTLYMIWRCLVRSDYY